MARYLALMLMLCAFASTELSANPADSRCGVEFTKYEGDGYSFEELQRRVANDPGDADALAHLGLLYEEQENRRRALELYEQAIHQRPECWIGYYFAGLVAPKVASDMEILQSQYFQKAVELDPELAQDSDIQAFWARTRRRPPPIMIKEAPSALGMGQGWTLLAGVGLGMLVGIAMTLLITRKRSVGQMPR